MFDNELNTVNAVQNGAVDHSEPDTGTSAVEGTQQNSEGVANLQPVGTSQSIEANHHFAEMRKKSELVESENGRLRDELAKLGYTGSIDEIAQRIAVEQSGMTPDDYKKQEAAFESRIQKDPRIVEAERITREATYKKDLQAIKEAYPDCKAESVQDLGDVYLNLMQSGSVNPVDAYAAQIAHNEREKAKIPAKIGAVNQTAQKTEKDFYTSEEVDRLSDEDLANPKIRAIVMKSMTKW